MIEVNEGSILNAWLSASQQIISVSGAHIPLLVTTIRDPSTENSEWFRRYNPGTIVSGAPNFRTIANMLAPSELEQPLLCRADRYRLCQQRIDRMRRRGLRLSNWRETYYERLTAFPGTQENQLENVILKLTTWGGHHKAALYIHIDGPTTTRLRPRGGPCLQYLQFGSGDNETTNLTAVYRSHDYFHKALGNFVGLARLLRFVCSEANRSVGSITCISLNAHTERKTSLTQLVNG